MRTMRIRQEIQRLLWVVMFFGLAYCAPLTAPVSDAEPSHVAPTRTPALTSTDTYPGPPPAATRAAPSSDLATATSAASCGAGTIVQLTLPDPRGQGTLPVAVYLPPCYAQSGDAYPVLYLLHGLNYDETQWLEMGLAESADALIRAGEIPPLLIVLPRDPDISLPPDSPFADYLLNTVLPEIETRYRVRSSARFRALGGVSRGAGWAVRIGLQHPELFSVLGWHSPALFWGDAPRLADWLAALPPDADLRVYVDSGNSDTSRQNALWLVAQLQAYGVPHEWHLYVGYHEMAYWQAHLEEYLRWYGEQLSP